MQDLRQSLLRAADDALRRHAREEFVGLVDRYFATWGPRRARGRPRKTEIGHVRTS